jgi:hypothetical protein
MIGTRKRRLLLPFGILVLVVALGITAVFAQEGEEDPLPEGQSDAPAPFGWFGHHSGGMRGFGGALEGITPHGQALADALDIPLEELEEAQASAHANWLAEMVTAGYMEQEQADLMLAYIALKGSINRVALTAEAMGISETALAEAREDGQTLAQMLEDAGLSIVEFMSAMQEAYAAAVQAEVGDSITQEQADQILSNGVGFGLGKPGFDHGGMKSFEHGFRGFGQRGQGMGHGFGMNRGFGNGSQNFGFGPASSSSGL